PNARPASGLDLCEVEHLAAPRQRLSRRGRGYLKESTAAGGVHRPADYRRDPFPAKVAHEQIGRGREVGEGSGPLRWRPGRRPFGNRLTGHGEHPRRVALVETPYLEHPAQVPYAAAAVQLGRETVQPQRAVTVRGSDLACHLLRFGVRRP